MNIKLSYLYRDGSNYKNFNEVIFQNQNSISIGEIEEVIRKNIIDDIWFVCNDWKLPDMHFKEFSYNSEIDHNWHEFESIEETLETATEESGIEGFLLVIDKVLVAG